jgi:hypothetical protein
MGRNLSNLYISSSFQFLTQISGSELQTGLGDTITGSLLITASKADLATTASYVASVVSASYAISSSYSNVSTSSSYALVSTSSSFATNANSASYATTAISSSYANNATSASFAVTASFALNAGASVNTGSLLTTASAVANIITFTKGDGSTFPVTVATGSNVSSSFASTSSLALLNVITASSTNATITYTKGDGTTFTNVINNVVNATSASFATSASQAVSASQAQNAVSASFYGGTVTSASYAATSSYATNFNVAGTLTATSASIQYLTTIFETASVIYSSGSNQFGDASNDTQTLYGTINILTGPTNLTGSVNSLNGYTGSLLGTASFATSASQAVTASYVASVASASFATSASQAISASYAFNSTSASFAVSSSRAVSASFATSASQAVSSSFATTASFALNVTPTNTGSLLVTASAVSNVITFTKGDGSTFPVTVNTGSAVSTFPFTGSAIISGSLTVTGSSNFTGGDFKVTDQGRNGEFDVDAFKVKTQTGAQFTGSFGVTGSVTGNVLGNNTDTFTSSAPVQQVVTLTQAEYNAIGSPNANTLYIISGSAPISISGLATTGSNTFTGNQVFSGSVRGEVKALSISSQTASLDCSTDNFFTLLLVSGSTTFVNPSNILPGQTLNLRVKQSSVASGSISFASSVKQVSGSAYTPTTTANAEDIVTFISFDSTNLYLSNIKNFI